MNTIKTFLHERNMTQTELADKLGVQPSYVSMIISGDRAVSDAFRWRWLSAFGQPLEDTNGNVTNISTTTQRQEPQP